MRPQTLRGQGAGSGSSRSGQRREMAGVLGLAVLAALSILFTTSRSWLGVTAARRPPFGPLRVELTGRDQYPALTGLAVVALLSVVLALVAGGVVRRVLGVLLVVAGGWAAWYASGGLSRPGTARVTELLGDRLAQGSGTLELRQYPHWPGLKLLATVVLAVWCVVLVVMAGHCQLGMTAGYVTPGSSF